MGYSNQKYYARVFVPAAFAVDMGTATASGSQQLTVATGKLPQFDRRTQINAVKFRTTAAPAAGGTLVFAMLNGTATFATVTVTGSASDSWIEGSVTAANAIFAADGQPTMRLDGTSTASGQGLGDYDIWFEQQELYQGA